MSERVGQSNGGVALIAGRYELIRELSTKQDIQECECFDSALQRRVVVRFLRDELVEDHAAVDRFCTTVMRNSVARTLCEFFADRS